MGSPEEIEKMDIKLKDLKNFLVDADRRSITDQSVQAWVLTTPAPPITAGSK